MKILIVLLISLLFISSAIANKISLPSVQIKSPVGIPSDPFAIKNLTIEGNSLFVDVQYGGGCEQHDFELLWGGSFKESGVAQADLYLVHDSNGDSCEALISKSVVFDLSNVDQKYISYHEESRQRLDDIILNVLDPEGKSLSITYEPTPKTFDPSFFDRIRWWLQNWFARDKPINDD